MTPNCSLGIATIIGLFGLLLTALLVSILTQKLYLTREEGYVHTFVMDTRLLKDHHQQAANVIKFAVKSWYLKRKTKVNSIHYFQAQRKLFRSICRFQKIKQEERSLKNVSIDFPEILTAQRTANAQIEDLATEVTGMKVDIKEMKSELYSLNQNLSTLQNTLNLVLDKL